MQDIVTVPCNLATAQSSHQYLCTATCRRRAAVTSAASSHARGSCSPQQLPRASCLPSSSAVHPGSGPLIFSAASVSALAARPHDRKHHPQLVPPERRRRLRATPSTGARCACCLIPGTQRTAPDRSAPNQCLQFNRHRVPPDKFVVRQPPIELKAIRTTSCT